VTDSVLDVDEAVFDVVDRIPPGRVDLAAVRWP